MGLCRQLLPHEFRILQSRFQSRVRESPTVIGHSPHPRESDLCTCLFVVSLTCFTFQSRPPTPSSRGARSCSLFTLHALCSQGGSTQSRVLSDPCDLGTLHAAAAVHVDHQAPRQRLISPPPSSAAGDTLSPAHGEEVTASGEAKAARGASTGPRRAAVLPEEAAGGAAAAGLRHI